MKEINDFYNTAPILGAHEPPGGADHLGVDVVPASRTKKKGIAIVPHRLDHVLFGHPIPGANEEAEPPKRPSRFVYRVNDQQAVAPVPATTSNSPLKQAIQVNPALQHMPAAPQSPPTKAPGPHTSVQLPYAFNAAPRVPVNLKDEALAAIRRGVTQGGPHGALELEQFFLETSRNSGGRIGFEQLKAALAALPDIQDRHFHALFRHYDAGCTGSIKLEELMDGVYGRLSDNQQRLVSAAFASLDRKQTGRVDIGDVIARFDCKNHPDHLSGRKSKAQIVREFMAQFNADTVEWKDFLHYYVCVGACTTDDEFTSLINETWHLSGADVSQVHTTPVSVQALAKATYVGHSPIFNPGSYQDPLAPRRAAAALKPHACRQSNIVLG